MPEYPHRLKVSDSLVIFRSTDTKAETELKAAEKQVGSHYTTAAPGSIVHGVCSHCGLTALKDQNVEDSYIQH